MKKIKVLIVDDHPIVREGLKLILKTEDKIEIADEAINGEEALNLIRHKTYDLILLDISMPVMDGLKFLKEKKKINNTTSVVILTTIDDQDVIRSAMSFGIKGFLLKDAKREEMVQMVLQVSKGEISKSLNILPEDNKKKKQIEAIKDWNLTKKELTVLKKVVKGATSKEIAIDMGITERTVKAHLTSVYRKLEVNSRTEAVTLSIIRKIVVI
ncbi:response regulator [Candidatus Galacturonibacter soehngenii]|uniref:Stage 0 sporulation protein A homolog n=1 Tax=Candidatus Galacturonatibacter soehngenii TaxID=2307010 RepID=A0A7V7QL62_9FIRM|nr:response regulator transcription factor [Candidatus Galacturonibacter soehngenii]KAB1438674.1 response regulator transcription factor [Candidatus Galacturonibacter soehngenii]MBA4685714.1 response regulator transcription factor [Candidatus Galacturonibacter soehngenii]